MTRGEARTRIKTAGTTHDADISSHALAELQNDGKIADDLYSAMAGVRSLVEQRGGTFAVDRVYSWRCVGPDLDGAPLGFVVKLFARVLVITAYAKTT